MPRRTVRTLRCHSLRGFETVRIPTRASGAETARRPRRAVSRAVRKSLAKSVGQGVAERAAGGEEGAGEAHQAGDLVLLAAQPHLVADVGALAVAALDVVLAAHGADLRIREGRDQCCERAVDEQRPHVAEDQDLAPRLADRGRLRRLLAAAGLAAYEPHAAVGEAEDDFVRAVVRRVTRDENLALARVVLREHAFERVADLVDAVVDGEDHADRGRRLGGRVAARGDRPPRAPQQEQG